MADGGRGLEDKAVRTGRGAGPELEAVPGPRVLQAALAIHAGFRPDAVAIAAPGRAPLSYAPLVEQVAGAVSALRACGIGRSDRVALALPAGPELAVAIVAVACAAAAAPLDPSLRPAEYRAGLAWLAPRLVIVPAGLDSPARQVATDLGIAVAELVPAACGTAGRFALTGGPGGPRLDDDGPAPEDVALVLATSGTTARPKLVPLTQANVVASAEAMASALRLDGLDRCLGVMPLFHIHGLMALIASLVAGASVAVTPRFDADRVRAWVEEMAPTWYTASPAIHQAIALQARRWPAGAGSWRPRFIRSCSAPLPPPLAAELEARLGTAVLEAYGMTEATHQIAVNPLPPRARKPGSVGCPAGAEVAIVDAAGRPLPPETTGEIVIRGAGVTRGYLAEPAVNAEAFRDGWLRTGDLGHLDADGYLFITGRLKEMINRGGEKIAPREVDEALGQHPAVAQAVSFAVPHATLGEDVGAAVILRAPGAVDAPALRAFVAERLADFKVPGRLWFVDEIPRTASGKPQRAALAERLAAGSAPGPAAGPPPRTATERALAAIWTEVLGVGEVGADTDFLALGGNSIHAAQVAARIAARLGIAVSMPDVFVWPTVAGLAVLIDGARALAGPVAVGDGGGVGSGIPGRGRGAPSPLSLVQQPVWVLHQLEPGLFAYNVPRALRLRGPLDVAALRRALDAVVERHEALRTTFVVAEPEPLQVVADPRPVDLPVVDLAGRPEAEREAALAERLAEEARRPFDLTADLMLRPLLIRLGDADHVLLLTIHHLATDGWSAGVLARELSALYAAFHEGRPARLPALPIQYADYSAWQRQRLAGPAFEQHLRYWWERLAGAPATLDLPADRPRPAIRTYRGARQGLAVSPAVAGPLLALSRREGVTPFMTLLAAFTVLLSRYTGQEDVVVGTPVAGRVTADTEPLIGLFVNTLVLRTDLSGDPTFRELLGRVKETCLGAYAHQDVPFQRLVEELRPARDPSRSPFFQVMLVLQSPTAPVFALPGLVVTPEPVDSEGAKFDLTLDLRETAGGLAGSIEYSTDLFEAQTIARLVAHLQRLLVAVATDADAPISALPLLTEAERRQIAQWNAPERTTDGGACLHEMFEAQARRTPDAVALTEGARAITYRELDRRANQLARHLRRHGAGPQARVGILLERSASAVVAILATLKAGAAYVPLDPAYPRERVAFMVTDARPAAVVTEERWRDMLPAGQWRVVALDREGPGIAQESEDALRGEVTPEDPAYVIYTSGSTGRPKGVLGQHRGMANLLAALWADYPFGPEEVCCQKTALSFVDAVWELFAPLLRGVPSVILGEEDARDPARLLRALAAARATRIVLVPSLLATLLDLDDLAQRVPALGLWMVGGEELPRDLADRFLAAMPGARLVNQYGASEASAVSTAWTVPAASPPGRVPIGRPLRSTTAYVLDRRGQPVPVGVEGDLYVGGAGLAHGYWQRPDLTAERFVPDPFSAAPGARLYRMGDRARYRADGAIEYLGRADQQVKLRGYRIELGEIESELRRHEAVRDAAVALRPDAQGDRRLVAYVVPAAPVTDGTLRAFLAERLPGHMVPAVFVTLERLPLTPSGKLDRRALPEARAGAGAAAYVAPRDSLESRIAGIWEELLGVRPVGRNANFFDLGGHSLRAVRLSAALGRATGIEVPVATIFRAPTVAELAEALRGEAPVQTRIAPREPGPGPWPLSSGQQRLWFLDQLEPHRAAYNVPAALRLAGPLDRDALRRALGAVVARHEALRTRFTVTGGTVLQVVDAPEGVALPVVDLTRAAAGPREDLLRERLEEEARRPFDLGRDPMLRATLFALGPAEHVLLLTLHHIASDGWSMGILFRELGAAYAAFARGAAFDPPALPIQYADYAVWQRGWLGGPERERHVAYWKDALAGAPAVLDLPTDHPRREARSGLGASVTARLSPDTCDALRALGRRERATLFMTLLAGWHALLYRYSGQPDIVVGSPVAGRNHPETEQLIGLFLNALCLRVDLSGNPTFRELLGRVREAALSAYAHQEVPFERIVEELAPDRTLGHAPLFQVFFNLLEFEDRTPVLPGLEVSPVALEPGTAKYDLTVSVARNGAGLAASLRYATDLFSAATADAMLAGWVALLESVVLAPDQRLVDLPLRPGGGRPAGAEPGEGAAAAVAEAFPPAALEGSIGARFEEQVRRHRDRAAIRSRRHTWSYGTLDRIANRVAHALLARLGPGEHRVGLLLGHDAPMIAAVLGSLKAGKTYVPLDPAYPRERLAALLADADVGAIVTEARHRAAAGALAAGRLEILCVDDLPAGAAEDDPPGRVAPETLAYLLYTSGSTGRPKAVMQSHRNVLHHVRAYTRRLGISAEDRLTLLPSYAFDAAVMDIFGALLNGATLCPWSVKEDGLAGIALWLRAEGISVYHSTPTLYRHFLASIEEGVSLAGVRRVVLGGEEVLPTDVELFNRYFAPPAVLVNGLGPTESTLALQHAMPHGAVPSGSRVPVGDPVEDTVVDLLDARGHPAVIGEIVIRSPYVALGYWRQPELTARAFRDDPGGGRWRSYHTGDLGRRRPDGAIEFIGRKDFQVKIRGFRVEPGEIEAALRRQPAVREAVVVAREDRPGDARLVAYVVAAPGAVPDAATLRGALQDRLPDHMVPATFVTLDALPLTPTGKVDRLALPAPPAGATGPVGAIAPRTATEERLARIWARVLGRETVGVTDGFFDVGGHSLLAVRLFAEIEREFGRRLPLATLFAAPTIEGLADLLGQEAWVPRRASLVALQPRGDAPPLFCVPGHAGTVLCFQELARCLAPEQPLYGLEPRGLGGSESPHGSIEAMAADYLREIRELQPSGPYFLGGFCFGGLVAYEMAQQLRAGGEQVGLLALFDANGRGPDRWHEGSLLRRLLARGGRRLAVEHANLRGLPLRSRLAYAWAKGRRLVRLTRERIGRRLGAGLEFDPRLRALARVQRAASRAYVRRPYPGPAVLFMAQRPLTQRHVDPAFGWGELVTGGLDVRLVPVVEDSVIQNPDGARAVAAELRARITGASAREALAQSAG